MRFVLASLAFLLAWAAGAQPSFTGVGDLTGGAVGSAALAISADGSVVVGESEGANGLEALRWTPGGGLVGIGFLSGASDPSTARAVSADGAVIVGASPDSGGVQRAWRWSGGIFTALGTLSCSSCDPLTEAYAVSGNGLVVTGSGLARSTGAAHVDPVRWPGGGTAISDLGNLPGSTTAGEAFGASFDGAWIVGSHTSPAGRDAWTWSGSGLVALPRLHADTPVTASALAVSADASTVVGTSTAGTVTLPGGTKVAVRPQAVRWTGAGFATIESLGTLPGATTVNSRANAVSPDGSVIVGRALDAASDDAGFLWDAISGMRELAVVLEDDYGLDLGDWVLHEATGVSEVVDGSFTIVGRGTNPAGDPEGWVAHVMPVDCSDGADNDGDGLFDFPDDPGCRSASDVSEEFDCEDGLDDDGDGDVDLPDDAGCRSPTDPTEEFDCADDLDNDGDGLFDFPDDPGCANPDWPREDPACHNGVDDDLDGQTDHPADAQCTSPSDLSEVEDCSDGLDNDGDGAIDHPSDAQCASPLDASEHPQCSDGLDNDGDGDVDHPAEYPACQGPEDDTEVVQCADGLDNDGDGLFDFPDDPGCADAGGESEAPFAATVPGLLVVDRASRTLFFVDAATGDQTPISEGASLSAPQGLVERGAEILVADPAGLFAVAASGVQRLASPPLDAGESLQVVLDAVGVPMILEAAAIARVTGSETGVGSKSVWLQLPAPADLFAWEGDSLAALAEGDFAATGSGFTGNGVYHIDGATKQATLLDPVFESRVWRDLAVEADGTLVAVGTENGVTGVVRIDPTTGLSTPLNQSHAWGHPTGVAVGSGGDIWVADAGSCAGATCSGGEIVHVDPVSGLASPLSSGGFIAGEMDLVVAPEPAGPLLGGVGAVVLLALARRRGRSGR